MREPIAVDLFAEDAAHENYLAALILRIADEEGMRVDVGVVSARGGHGRVLAELALYRQELQAGETGREPEVVVVGIDVNCLGFKKARSAVASAAGTSLMAIAVLASPDPHIERWYMADTAAFERVVGSRPKVGKKKCDKDHYKAMLRKAIRDAGRPATLGGMEFAPDLVRESDLYQAGQLDKSLKRFCEEFRTALRAAGSGQDCQ